LTTVTDYTITPIDLKTATDEEIYPLWECFSQLRAERQPDDPPFPFADYLTSNRNRYIHWEELVALIKDPITGKVIARAMVETNNLDNLHLAFVELGVLPAYRQQGLGRRLMGWAAETAQAKGRSKLFFGTHERAPGGAIFAEKLGANPGLVERISQLVLSEVDRELMRSWQERAAERASGFEIGFWAERYPEEELPAIVELLKVMNTAPRDNLDFEDEVVTPETVREAEENMVKDGVFRWTVYAREKATGEFAGFTEIYVRKSIPSIVHQGGTGVFPRYRNLGLGRWVKAAMIERVLNDLPEARFVRTGNAESNAPMLGINVAMGFKPYLAVIDWQVETEKVLQYVGS
jgi:GNAT superfamily N-acetyltransferase